MGIVGNLSPEQLRTFDSQGFIVIESFASTEEIDVMRKRMDQLLDEFDCSSASVFSSKNQQELTNNHLYFWQRKLLGLMET